jgi:hypothetical protein
MRNTECLPFNFAKTHKGVPRDYMDNENTMIKLTNMPLSFDPVEDAR